jgi:hypothetical protein
MAIYDSNLKATRVLAADDNKFEKAYRMVIRPIYTVCPKPGELSDLVKYLVSSEDTEEKISLVTKEIVHQKLNIWPPLWSNLAFIVVLLGISCIHVTRRDF